jgi:hypothetical protein
MARPRDRLGYLHVQRCFMTHRDEPPRGLAKLLPAIKGVRLGAGTAAEEVVIKYIPDAELGAARREQLTRFGKLRGADIHAERKIEHEEWNQAAAVVWLKDPTLKKVTVAGIIKRDLKLAEGISAIRHVIKKPGK